MSKIYYTKERLEQAVQQSSYFTEVFEKLGARKGGNTYQRVKSLIAKYQIDTSHFPKSNTKGFLKSGISTKKDWKEILVASKKSREKSRLLRRALQESGREYICECCKLKPEWNKKPLTLQVDHIDGDWTNCCKENLRFLCPNCHTQMPTYCNQGKRKTKRCANCNAKITMKSKHCRRCAAIFRPQTDNNKRKVERPPLDVLLKEVESLGYVATGKKYGVSDNAVRKWIRVEQKRLAIIGKVTQPGRVAD
jgi:hypothetical protein